MKLIENKKHLILIIFVCALLVRLGTMVALETYRFKTEKSFGYGYGATAKHVALGDGFSLGYDKSGAPRATAISPPGYVYFLALIFSTFGVYSVESAMVIEILQSLTAALTCLVFYHLGHLGTCNQRSDGFCTSLHRLTACRSCTRPDTTG